MNDRGMIKWQPFDSVISSKSVIRKILTEKEKISSPTLSSDQLVQLQERLLSSYYNQEQIKISYFYNGKIFTIIGLIKVINHSKKLIIFDNNKSIHFEQLIKIEQICK